MISISRLLCDSISPGDHLRYEKKQIVRPVVVWNCTRRCNLNCIHCYASAGSMKSPSEMDTTAGKAFIRDLADFGVPVILFSGGEPLLREDLFDLASYAQELGLRLALSTNGTLINDKMAGKIHDIGFAEVGISIDGTRPINDHFRGQNGAYDAAIEGIRNCIALGLRVSLRLTITRFNYLEIPAIFKLLEDENIDRVCFYHLAYSGRASNQHKNDISHSETRSVIDTICEHTMDLHKRGLKKEVLTVGNHADGVYIYRQLKERDTDHADRVLNLLKSNGGNNSGIKIGAVDDQGNVHPDQFWWHYSFGNVRQRKFSDIWMDTSDPLMKGLKNRKELLKARCSQCQYLDLCNGNLRIRAEAIFNDIWAEDPACYLNDHEIGIV